MSGHKRVALALGSGGARGYAHVGVVEVLQERGYEVVAVAGTSMGALVGGFVAADRLSAFSAWARDLRARDIVRLADPQRSSGGAIAGDRVMSVLAPLLGQNDIETLPIPYTAVATDLVSAREVWFQTGSLLEAIRASIAIPGAITPALVGGRLLADGGLLNPLPIDPWAATRANLTIAVSLQGPRPKNAPVVGARATPATSARVQDARASMGETLRALASRGYLPPGVADRWRQAGEVASDALEGRTTAELEPALDPVGGLKNSGAVALSLEAMQQLILRYRLAAQSPDLLLSVPLNTARTLDFHRAAELIEVGRSLAEEGLYQLEGDG